MSRVQNPSKYLYNTKLSIVHNPWKYFRVCQSVDSTQPIEILVYQINNNTQPIEIFVYQIMNSTQPIEILVLYQIINSTQPIEIRQRIQNYQ